ncbi:hypothetical protein F4779DRAFT_588204 [Xylariaceae sp. FL0662B]|nr:hypothetical protein F4779DRAFT_588204 [Xylariaceae sp. FL0662B]
MSCSVMSCSVMAAPPPRASPTFLAFHCFWIVPTSLGGWPLDQFLRFCLRTADYFVSAIFLSRAKNMEPVSLALGVLPLLGGALKLYKATDAKLKIFRHYSREIDRLQKQFERQRQFFLNETHLVLRIAVGDESQVRQMVDDGEHPKWCSPSLSNDIEQSLGENCRFITEIIEDIGNGIKQWQEGLACFRCLEEQKQEGEDLKNTIRRLRKRVKIVFDKSKFDNWTKELRNFNDDLKSLREQIQELETPVTRNFQRNCARARLPRKFTSFGATRKACQALHNALGSVWSSQDASQFRHLVKLLLDTKHSEEIQLDIIICCMQREMTQKNLIRSSMVTVHVKSEALDWIYANLPTPPSDSSLPRNDRRKRQRVRFTDEKDDDDCPSSCTVQETPRVTTSVDLSQSGHFCSTLISKPIDASEKSQVTCLGHLDTCSDENLRHSFFQCCKGTCYCGHLTQDAGELTHMDEILAVPRSEELSVVDQLRLAFRIASAVLKFNSTPWLSQHWCLHDLAFFQRDSDLPASLQSLHVSLELAENSPERLSAAMDVDCSGLAGALEDAKLLHGIQNLTLYNLGVALLSIARWTRIDPNDVLQVRRMASQSCPLGPRYQEIAQKVLECDFGYGKDLRKPRLQEAVYNDVLVELEGMIASLDLNGES